MSWVTTGLGTRLHAVTRIDLPGRRWSGPLCGGFSPGYNELLEKAGLPFCKKCVKLAGGVPERVL